VAVYVIRRLPFIGVVFLRVCVWNTRNKPLLLLSNPQHTLNSYHSLWHCIISPNVNQILEYSQNCSNQLISISRLDLGISYNAVSNEWILELQMLCKNDFCCQIFWSSGERCFSLFEGIKSHLAETAEKNEEHQS